MASAQRKGFNRRERQLRAEAQRGLTLDHEDVIGNVPVPLDTMGQKAHTGFSNGAKAPITMKGKAMTDATAAGTEGSKRAKLDYKYRDHAGVLQDSFTKDSRSVHITVLGNGESVETHINEIITDQEVLDRLTDAEHGYPMAIMAFLFGIKTTTGNSVTSVKDGNPDDMLRAIATRKATIVEDKEWREGGGGGPRTGHIIDAVCAVLKAQSGKEVTAKGREVLKATILEKGAKHFTDDPVIKAEIDAAEMRRIMEKAAASKAKAAQAGSSILSGLVLE